MRADSLAAAAVLALLAGCATNSASSRPGGVQATSSTPTPTPGETIPAAATAAAPSKPTREPPLVLPPVESLEPEVHLAQGRAALEAKNAPLAAAHLRACAEKAPSNVDCQWELGWSYYLLGAWPEVVSAWEKVEALDPKHEELAERLAEARGQVELRRKLDQMAAAAPAPVRTPPPEGTLVRLRAVGDVNMGTAFPEGYLPPEDGALEFASVKDILRDADLTFVNLEGPLCDTEEKSDKCRRSSNCYAFRTPTSYGQHLVDAGVDVASTANNHAGDFGEPCRRQTEATLDALGIAWSGPPGTIATLERNGVRIALIGFHTSASCNDVNDHETAVKLVEAARANHDVVIVSFHGGAEGAKALHVPKGEEKFFKENRGDLRTFTHKMVDAGADLVIGHGPHVVRGMELYKDRLIAYSLGNFATYGRFNLTGHMGLGVVLDTVFDAQGRFVSGKLIPTHQLGEGVPEPDPRNGSVDLIRLLSSEDFPEYGVVIDREGNITRRTAPVSSSR